LRAAASPVPKTAGPDAAGADLLVALTEARRLGFLGPGPVTDQLARSLAFASAAGTAPENAIDLGTGGGLPGLVLAVAWPGSHWALVDSNLRRSRWLAAVVERLGMGDRCRVVAERAELVGRGPLRYQADLVTARSFGPPAPTAECGAPLLRLGGRLVVADPPEVCPERWPLTGLAAVGLALEGPRRVSTEAGPVSLSVLVSQAPCPDRYPRRVGAPFKRPLF